MDKRQLIEEGILSALFNDLTKKKKTPEPGYVPPSSSEIKGFNKYLADNAYSHMRFNDYSKRLRSDFDVMFNAENGDIIKGKFSMAVPMGNDGELDFDLGEMELAAYEMAIVDGVKDFVAWIRCDKPAIFELFHQHCQ